MSVLHGTRDRDHRSISEILKQDKNNQQSGEITINTEEI